MWRHRLPRRGMVRHGQYETHLPSEPLCQGHSFQLRGPQLSLEIAEPALNLDQEDLCMATQDHVGSSTIRRPRHRHLEAHAPRLVRLGRDLVGQRQLARVPSRTPSSGYRRTERCCPNPRAMLAIDRRSGEKVPPSILLMTGWLLPDRDANWRWVRPAALRAIATSRPNCPTRSARVTRVGSPEGFTAPLALAYRARLLRCAA